MHFARGNGAKYMERIYFRERTVFPGEAQAAEPVWNVTGPEKRKKIAVVGISRGAGATFIATSLAFLLSKNVESQQGGDGQGGGRGGAAERHFEAGSGREADRLSGAGGGPRISSGGIFSEKSRWPEYGSSRSLTRMVRERTFLAGYGGGREERRSVLAGSGPGAGSSAGVGDIRGGVRGGVRDDIRGGQPGCPAAGAAYVELRQPAAGEAGGFFAAGLDLRFRGNRFTDFFEIYMQGKPLPPRVNLHKGINWVVWRTPANSNIDGVHLGMVSSGAAFTGTPSAGVASADEVSPSTDFAGAASADAVFNDAGPARAASAGADLAGFPLDQLAGQWIVADSPPLEMLQRYDLVIGVIDPLPSRIFAGAETYEYLRDAQSSGLPLLWVVNCDNAEVNHSELKRFLRLPAHCSLPLLNPALLYRAQYACRLPAELLAAGGSPVKDFKEGSISSTKNSDSLQQQDLAFAALKGLEKEVRKRLEE